jgi:hypothetical protein
MQVGGYATSEPAIAWWLDVKGVGESLRERYQVPEKLTPKLLKLVSKLDAIEGYQLLRSSESRLGRKEGIARHGVLS